MKVVFTDRVGKYLKYDGHNIDENKLLADQWGARKLTTNSDIPLTSKISPLLDSSYSLYSDNNSTFEVPEVASVVPFYPEIDHFLDT